MPERAIRQKCCLLPLNNTHQQDCGGHPLSNALLHRLQSLPPPSNFIVAYSGGLDSHVLLHLCNGIKAKLPALLCALHIHHGLQEDASLWARHCEHTCLTLDIPYVLESVDARAKPGQSREEAARTARYDAIIRHMASNTLVLTAQHQDDQAETLLLQLLRGSGLAGLAAMPAYAPLGPGYIARPLLEHSRRELENYANACGLRWMEDPSNADTAYDRNFLRHQLMPLIKTRWPSASASLSRSAKHCAEAQQQLNIVAQALLLECSRVENGALSVAGVLSKTAQEQRLILRYWIAQQGQRLPSARVLDRIINEVLTAKIDKSPLVQWSSVEIRRYRDSLLLLPQLPAFDAAACYSWSGVGERILDNNGELAVAISATASTDDSFFYQHTICADLWKSGDISVSYRRGGERCALPGRKGSHTLKNLFQEAGIPPWLRERIPLIHIDGRLAMVMGIGVVAGFETSEHSNDACIMIRWRPYAYSAAAIGALPIPRRNIGQTG